MQPKVIPAQAGWAVGHISDPSLEAVLRGEQRESELVTLTARYLAPVIAWEYTQSDPEASEGEGSMPVAITLAGPEYCPDDATIFYKAPSGAIHFMPKDPDVQVSSRPTLDEFIAHLLNTYPKDADVIELNAANQNQ